MCKYLATGQRCLIAGLNSAVVIERRHSVWTCCIRYIFAVRFDGNQGEISHAIRCACNKGTSKSEELNEGIQGDVECIAPRTNALKLVMILCLLEREGGK